MIQHAQRSSTTATPRKVSKEAASKKHTPTPLGQRIVELRKSLGMNQAQLARGIGLSAPSLWEIESGITANPRSETILALATALRTDPGYLVNGTENITAESMTADEKYVISHLRRMTRGNIDLVRALVAALARQEKQENKPKAPKKK